MPKAGGSLKALQAGMPLAKTENLQRRRAMQKSGVLHFDPGLPLFREHFPGAPRVPGSLIIAALAEEAGPSARQGRALPLPPLSHAGGLALQHGV